LAAGEPEVFESIEGGDLGGRRDPMKTTRSILAVACALVVLLMSVSSAVAQGPTSIVWGVKSNVENTDEDKVIPGTFPTYWDAKQCGWKECSDMEGVAFQDVDVSQQMADYEEGADFRLFNYKMAPTQWFVCAFDANDQARECWRGGALTDSILNGKGIPESTEWMRLMTYDSPPAEYRLDIDVW
jgi:hypothetical protein